MLADNRRITEEFRILQRIKAKGVNSKHPAKQLTPNKELKVVVQCRWH